MYQTSFDPNGPRPKGAYTARTQGGPIPRKESRGVVGQGLWLGRAGSLRPSLQSRYSPWRPAFRLRFSIECGLRPFAMRSLGLRLRCSSRHKIAFLSFRNGYLVSSCAGPEPRDLNGPRDQGPGSVNGQCSGRPQAQGRVSSCGRRWPRAQTGAPPCRSLQSRDT